MRWFVVPAELDPALRIRRIFCEFISEDDASNYQVIYLSLLPPRTSAESEFTE